MRKSDPAICSRCKPAFCKKGSSADWACPYGLNVDKITDNVDCGLCTECVGSCLFDNVTL